MPPGNVADLRKRTPFALGCAGRTGEPVQGDIGVVEKHFKILEVIIYARVYPIFSPGGACFHEKSAHGRDPSAFDLDFRSICELNTMKEFVGCSYPSRIEAGFFGVAETFIIASHDHKAGKAILLKKIR